jgi:hypothetical protein
MMAAPDALRKTQVTQKGTEILKFDVRVPAASEKAAERLRGFAHRVANSNTH